MSTQSQQKPAALAKLRLPHPYLTTYYVVPSDGDETQTLQIQRGDINADGQALQQPLHNDQIFFGSLQNPEEQSLPPPSNNTFSARAQRAPSTTVSWKGVNPPSSGQIWLIVYAIFTQHSDIEFFKLKLQGSAVEHLQQQLKASSLATDNHVAAGSTSVELLILRATFWQGAGSPFGGRSVWIPKDGESSDVQSVEHIITTKFPETRVHTWHPRRAQKPRPGSVIYSRYIPSLDEHFSMVALDYQNSEHLGLFHKWQNDPRVAKGWNETGTLDQHREYCRKLHEDPHILTVLARFEDEYFAYFEIYWGKEDHLGAYYDAQDFDRGRHSLVGETKFRGRYRVTAWWSGIMHYIFLDDPRTMRIVGEPKATNSSVLAYDFMHGFSMDKFVDLPHKRSALMKCGRERFFQLCPLDHEGGFIGGTQIQLPAKL